MCVRVLRSTKIGHFYTKTQFLTFSEIFSFGWFWPVFPTLRSILGARLAPIASAMEQSIVRHIQKNFSASGPEGVGAPRPEIQGKTWDFQESQLLAHISQAQCASNWIPRNHVVYQPRSTPGTWNFWPTYAEKKARAAEAEICRRPYLTRASR